MLPAGAPALDLTRSATCSRARSASCATRLRSRNIHFAAGGSLPAEGQDAILDAQAEDIKRVAELSSTMGVTTRVTLIGHANSAGQGTSNLSLSVARAEAVRALLKKRGVNPDLLAVRGAGAMEPLQEENIEKRRDRPIAASHSAWGSR